MNQFTFKLKPFLLLNFLAVSIFISWNTSITLKYWDLFDIWVFESLNPVLSGSSTYFWAILSVRSADLITLGIILLFFWFLFKKTQRVPMLISFVSVLFLMLVVRELLDAYLSYIDLSRKSPSLVLDNVIRLSEIYPNLDLKDYSVDSFPGDHAGVLITWLGFCLFFACNRWSFLMLIVVILFSLPRLITGAHWASDVFVGGVVISFISLAFGIYTPMLNKLNKFIFKLTPKFLTNV